MPLTPFADGPGNTASGVAVYNNDLYLEALANAKEPAFSTYKTIMWGGAQQGGAGPGTFLMYGGGAQTASSALLTVGTAGTASLAFYLDPADWAAGSRTTKLRIRTVLITNATAPGITFTTGLYPVGTWGGASGANPTIATLSTVISGSTSAIASPALSTRTVVTSGDFNAPAADHYAFAVVYSGTANANANVTIVVHLQMRQV